MADTPDARPSYTVKHINFCIREPLPHVIEQADGSFVCDGAVAIVDHERAGQLTCVSLEIGTASCIDSGCLFSHQDQVLQGSGGGFEGFC
jgi:hypothetical protein